MSSVDSGTKEIVWRKSRRSVGNGACVEIAPVKGKISVRDSKNPGGLVLAYTAETWRSFVREAKTGDFDYLP
jgi:Domain of unknown function (DUF397)